jgi:hypothetical protein
MPTGLKSFNYSLLLALYCILSSCSDLGETPSTIPPSFLVDSVRISWIETYLTSCNYDNDRLGGRQPVIVHNFRLTNLDKTSLNIDSLLIGAEGYYESGDNMNIKCFLYTAQNAVYTSDHKPFFCAYGENKYGVLYDCDPEFYRQIKDFNYVLLKLAGRDSLPLLHVYKSDDYNYYPPGRYPKYSHPPSIIEPILATHRDSLKKYMREMPFKQVEKAFWDGGDICDQAKAYIRVEKTK